MENGKVRVNLWITKGMYDGADAIASADGRSFSDVIREALRDYLEAHTPRIQPKLLMEASHGSSPID
jgi:metal-responsive CopG/Arc/MetJ family transcriptional regulator